VDVEGYRRTSHEVWEAMASGWERCRAQLADALAPVREWLIGKLGSQPEETVLELGAGTGETGFETAALLGEDGRLLSTDFSPDMVEVAHRRGRELGLSNVDHRVIEAERIELDSGSDRRRALVVAPGRTLVVVRRPR
jgi:ubiquinone/menaquinone biosynthesis C-methylase UbiE